MSNHVMTARKGDETVTKTTVFGGTAIMWRNSYRQQGWEAEVTTTEDTTIIEPTDTVDDHKVECGCGAHRLLPGAEMEVNGSLHRAGLPCHAIAAEEDEPNATEPFVHTEDETVITAPVSPVEQTAAVTEAVRHRDPETPGRTARYHELRSMPISGKDGIRSLGSHLGVPNAWRTKKPELVDAILKIEFPSGE